MPIKIDRDNCIKCGACERLCPECFKLDDDDLATVIKEDPADNLETAVDACPTGAIIIDSD